MPAVRRPCPGGSGPIAGRSGAVRADSASCRRSKGADRPAQVVGGGDQDRLGPVEGQAEEAHSAQAIALLGHGEGPLDIGARLGDQPVAVGLPGRQAMVLVRPAQTGKREYLPNAKTCAQSACWMFFTDDGFGRTDPRYALVSWPRSGDWAGSKHQVVPTPRPCRTPICPWRQCVSSWFWRERHRQNGCPDSRAAFFTDDYPLLPRVGHSSRTTGARATISAYRVTASSPICLDDSSFSTIRREARAKRSLRPLSR